MIGIIPFAVAIFSGADPEPSIDLYLAGGNAVKSPNLSQASDTDELISKLEHSPKNENCTFYVIDGEARSTPRSPKDRAAIKGFERRQEPLGRAFSKRVLSYIDPTFFSKEGAYQTYGLSNSDGTESGILARDLSSFLAYPEA